MPYTITSPDQPTIDIGAWQAQNFHYDYPQGLDLKPGSETHQRILARVMRYGLESARVITRRHKSWEDIDEKLTAYIPTSEKENEVRNKDRRKPVSIVFPYSYAILETLVSYMVAAFFPEPIFRYEGSGPEDIAGAMLMEKLIMQHCNHNKVSLNLHTLFRDAAAYGFGVVSPQWTVKKGKKIGRQSGQAEDVTLFEGNSLYNIDPYRYLPDPAMPIHEVQRGEYVGWMSRTNYMDLLSEEQEDDGLFNVQYLQYVSTKVSSIFGLSTHFNRRSTNRYWDISLNRMVSDPVDQVHMYVKLIPKQWNLGSSTVPEKWFFTIAGDAVIIRAQPLGLNHDMFPVAICAPDFDGYSPLAYSRLEILSGMQTVIDWLFNSHITNVRKAINDMLIIDPYLININDLKDPEPGGLIRLRRPAWGKNMLDHAVKQLNIVDITKENMQDVSLIIRYMQQVGGTDNPMMGSLRTGGPERLTGAEFKGTAQGAVSRLERIAKIIGVQAMQDVGYMFAHHAQQLMSQDAYVRTSGDWPADITQQLNVQQGRVKISPRDILVDYDLIVRDGSIPGGNFDAENWLQFYKLAIENPQIGQRLDIFRLFEYIATNMGAKNIDSFRSQQPQQANVGTAPDERVQQQVQQGNLTPLMGATNGVY